MTPVSALRVSIIIPHFNRARLLAETLTSVLAQTQAGWEVIVVDDGSDEVEWQAIQAFAGERVRILRREGAPKGPSRCRNLGAAAARGEFLLFLDSDDLLAPWCLEERLKLAGEFPNHDIWVFPVMLFKQAPGDTNLCWNRLEGDGDLERFLRSDPPWHTSSPLWRRAAFERIGGFNEAVMYGDDADLHVRALLCGLSHRKFPHVLPDAFVRRSESTRITNSLTPDLLQSRLTRLVEGTRALRAAGVSGRLLDIWEGQYFVEGEFLLFNVERPGPFLKRVIVTWRSLCAPSFVRQVSVQGYLNLSATLRKRCYLLVRLARRIVMLVLPRDYFPRGGGVHESPAAPQVLAEVRRRLEVERRPG